MVTPIRNRAELVVPFPRAEVWRVLSDLALYPEWWGGMFATRILSAKPGLVGSEFEVRPWMGPSFRCRVAEADEPHSLTFRFGGGLIEGPGAFHLRARETGTAIHYEVDVHVRGLLMAIASWLMPVGTLHVLQMRLLLRRLRGRLRHQQRVTARLDARAEEHRRLAERESAQVPAEAVERMAADPTAEPGPHSLRESNFEMARRYLAAMSAHASPGEIAAFFTGDGSQITYPHRFLARTVSHDLPQIEENWARDRRAFRSQSFELRGATGGGSQVAMEVVWKGVVADSSERFPPGGEIEAKVAILLSFRDGRIRRRRTYACFEAWSSPADRDRAQAQPRPEAEPPASGSPLGNQTRPAESNFEIARRFLDTLSTRADPEAVAAFYQANAVQGEYPTRYLKAGAVRDLAGIKEARGQALALLSREGYELRGACGGGSQVVLEVRWTGEIEQAMGPFVPGQKLEAHLAMFLRFDRGLIVRQRTYGCWPATYSS